MAPKSASVTPITAIHSYNLHEPFLERAAAKESATSANIGLGAFLTLRLADHFSEDDWEDRSDALAYQVDATHAFLHDLQPREREVAHLLEIVLLARSAHRKRLPKLLWPALLAFAYWLEEQLRLREALDVLDTALQLRDEMGCHDEAATHLQRARVLRLTARLDEAQESYRTARKTASRIGDTHSEHLSWIGEGVVLQKRGNLPESERILRGVVSRAQQSGDRDAEARARHDLSATLFFAGRVKEAVPYAFQAYELYDHPHRRARALGDTGSYLKELGLYRAAKQAFSAVLVDNPTQGLHRTMLLELLELSALNKDRLTFERLRRQLEKLFDELLPDDQVDFELKAGQGLLLFDQSEAAIQRLERAVELAARFKLGERLFRAETVLETARECRETKPAPATLPPEIDRECDTALESTLKSIYALEQSFTLSGARAGNAGL